MEKIFSYLDYRKFLKEAFDHLKKTRRGITHRSLCKKAGFSSPNFLKLVMEGERNLTAQSLPKVSEAFELRGKEAQFFEALVFFNQAKTVEEKDQRYEQLKGLRKDLSLKRIEHGQFEYFERWYAVAIREMISLKDFREDPEWISARLQGKLTPTEVGKTIVLLERLGLVSRNEKGDLIASQPSVSTGDEVSSLAVYRFHQAMLEKAQEALKETPREQRDVSSVTVAISKEQFQKIKNKIQLFRKEILEMAQDTQEAETVYQLNIQFFNLSEVPWDPSRKS